jgi:hypothetical protein
MPLPSSGNPIRLGQIQTEFGGSNPISIGEYYRGGAYTTSNNTNVPTGPAGVRIKFSDFYGSRRAVFGCTDPSAKNYNPNATNNDGSCSYPTTYSIIPVTRYINTSTTNGYPFGDHICTTSRGIAAPFGYSSEGTLCQVYSTQAPGTTPILDADGAGRPNSGVMGYAYIGFVPSVPYLTIYALTNGADTMWSTQTSEGSYSLLRTEFYAPIQSLTI